MLRSQCSNSCRLFANNYTYHSTPSPGRMADNWQRQRKERMCCRMTTMTKASAQAKRSTGLNIPIPCPVRRSWQRNGAATCACTCTMQTEHRSGCSTARQVWRRAISIPYGLRRTRKGTSSPSTRKTEPR